jgi:polysaccharide deacetylase 2 family uncharacterized protein YibQ
VQARAASAAGHELLVHLPMEPFNKAADAGPHALHSSMTTQQLKEHLNWALAQFEGEAQPRAAPQEPNSVTQRCNMR